ncbi:O-antigen ligase family protein [Compostimonas suwonensis]|uniref:O-antigen ligase family protein n=1 Tax=Compostimonas suwonensis TaxID=1048394 RepID=UPI000C247C24|nr:O-antigen ligase family protein [Compostimonas suwonensis]
MSTHSTSELIWIGIAALVVFVTGGYFSFKIPKPVLLAILLGVAVLQVFEPIGYISIALLLPIVFAPAILRSSRRAHWNLWVMVLLAVLAWQLVSVLWAANDGTWAQAVLSTVSLVLCYLAARQVVATRGGLTRALVIAAPVILLEIALVVLFRFSPALEALYLRSPIAALFSEPDVELIFSRVPQNVLDPDKAGGFLLNGNIASLLLAAVAFLYGYAYFRSRRRVLLVVAAAGLIGCVATGSKTALVLLILLPSLTLFFLLLLRRSRAAFALLGLVVVGFIVTVIVLASAGSPLISTSLRTLGERGQLWALAGKGFLEHPFLGLGYGGWAGYLRENADAVFASGRQFQDLPTHNVIVQAWADAGIPLAVLVVAAATIPIAVVIAELVRRRSQPVLSSSALGLGCLLIAIVWFFAHAMADTIGFFGENHTLPYFGVIVAVIYFEREQGARREDAVAEAAEGSAIRSARPV